MSCWGVHASPAVGWRCSTNLTCHLPAMSSSLQVSQCYIFPWLPCQPNEFVFPYSAFQKLSTVQRWWRIREIESNGQTFLAFLWHLKWGKASLCLSEEKRSSWLKSNMTRVFCLQQILMYWRNLTTTQNSAADAKVSSVLDATVRSRGRNPCEPRVQKEYWCVA